MSETQPKVNPQIVRSSEFLRLLIALAVPLVLISNLMRGYVVWMRFHAGDFADWFSILRAFGWGFVFDGSALIYLFIPFALFYALVPPSWLQRRMFYRWFMPLGGFLVFLWLLVSAAEVAFFNEFQSRYNFIAVDYLVYTNTVINNIFETYPILPLLSGVIALVAILMFGLTRVFRLEAQSGSPWTEKVQLLIGWAVAAGVVFFAVDEGKLLPQKSLMQSEVAKNALHTLFAAYLNNEIEFSRFYPTLPPEEAIRNARRLLASEHDVVVPNVEAKKLNLIVVAMESMSARYLAPYGEKNGLTPNLSSLSEKGLFFRNLYATGTRTVRGLEAITLSVPPTPGQSILRRPNNERLFNIGSAFRQNGYQTQFIYGGYAWFDNMKHFFANNGFQVVDESNFAKDKVTFANAWGVCDEDLFRKAIHEADQAFHQNKPFFQLVLTTSNHRPYTYPLGKIDIPPKTGRDGAVKYSDYAIGQLLKEAESKPWYKDTVFVFIADHNAAVAGRTEIPVEDYLIPLIIYSPAHIQPQMIQTLGSQIDFAPTLLSLLNIPYEKKRFFGHDLIHAKTERAFLATYQNVAYLKDKKLAILLPRKMVELVELDDKLTPIKKTKMPWTAELLANPLYLESLSFYQAASELFKSGAMKE